MMLQNTPTISASEWQTRVDLAALYRLAAAAQWDDLIFTHISARVPGPDAHFLINPLGVMFEEITASNLVKIDLAGNIIDDLGDVQVNRAGFIVHSAIHAANENAHFIVHLHTLDGMAVAAQAQGLLPLNQISLSVLPRLAYHDYEGIAFDEDERVRMGASLGDKSHLILRHHGTLGLGESAGAAWLAIYGLERACSIQIRAQAAGPDQLVMAPAEAQQKVAHQVADAEMVKSGTKLVWEAMLRKLRRDSPGFDA
jgi:ribulose-5-phosphate 4-epimerase/fuculose-1-phosphate aldolase